MVVLRFPQNNIKVPEGLKNGFFNKDYYYIYYYYYSPVKEHGTLGMKPQIRRTVRGSL